MSLRVNLSAAYRVSDVLRGLRQAGEAGGVLYKELQYGLRAAIGTRTPDELLENKGVIDEVVAEHIRRRTAIRARSGAVGVKDIILPAR